MERSTRCRLCQIYQYTDTDKKHIPALFRLLIVLAQDSRQDQLHVAAQEFHEGSRNHR